MKNLNPIYAILSACFVGMIVLYIAILSNKQDEINAANTKYVLAEKRAVKAEETCDSLRKEVGRRVTQEDVKKEILETIRFCRVYYREHPESLIPDYD